MSNKKIALITGANRGIGKALTQKLLKEGYHVIAGSRSGNLDGLQHENLTAIKLDITDRKNVEDTLREVGQQFGQIDLLINNAGVGLDLKSIEPEYDAFVQTFNTNVTGTVFFNEAALPLVKDGGRILIVSTRMSLSGYVQPNAPAYRMSKAALNTYTLMLAERLKPRNIHVLALHPGWVQTDMGGSQASLTVEQSAAGIFDTIGAKHQSGSFWNIESKTAEAL